MNKVGVEKKIALDVVADAGRLVDAYTSLKASVEQGTTGGFTFTQVDVFDADSGLEHINRTDFLQMEFVIEQLHIWLTTTEIAGDQPLNYLYRIMDRPVG